MEKHLSSGNINTADFEQKRTQLHELLKVESRGAWVRSRFQHVNENDKSTRFFFDLERRRSSRKMITHLKMPDGTISEDPSHIKTMAREFYENLYSPNEIDNEKIETILTGLPQLSEDSKVDLDQPITFQELSKSVRAVHNNKVPGIDGNPSEFYKTFWDKITFRIPL